MAEPERSVELGSVRQDSEWSNAPDTRQATARAKVIHVGRVPAWPWAAQDETLATAWSGQEYKSQLANEHGAYLEHGQVSAQNEQRSTGGPAVGDVDRGVYE